MGFTLLPGVPPLEGGTPHIQFLPRLTEQPGEQRHEDDADEGDTTARHKLFHALGFCARVVVAISFQKVDDTPNCEARTESDYESLENTYCAVEKLHDFFAGIIFAQVKISR